MSEWVKTKFSEVCLPEKGSIISGPFGSNISSKFFVPNGVPVIRGNNLSLSFDKFYDNGFVFVTEEKADELNCYAEEGDLIFTAAGTIGQVGLLELPLKYKKYVISNKQLRARIDTKKVDLLYAYYWFSSKWMQAYFLRNNKGSTVPLISLSELKESPISYPTDVEIQNRIVQVVESLSRKIDTNQKICAELESLAKTIYDYWFLQFEFPNDEGKPYKSSGGKMVWCEELKREIPEGWEVSSLRSKITLEKGLSYTSKDIESGDGVPMINLACIDRNRDYRDGELKFHSGKIPKKAYLESGDLLIACTDLTRNADIVGSPILVPDDDNIYTYSTDISKLIPSNEHFNKYYLYMTLRTDFYHNYIKKWASGTNVLHLNVDGINWYTTWIPPMNLQNRYANIIKAVHKQKSKTLKENRELAALRDWLLPMLMNGQVGFKEQER